MKLIEQYNVTSIKGITYFGPNAKCVFEHPCGRREEMVWSPDPTGTQAERITELLSQRIRIDAELRAAGVTFTPGKDGVSWSRT